MDNQAGFTSPLVDHLPHRHRAFASRGTAERTLARPRAALLRRHPEILPRPGRQIAAREDHSHRQDRGRARNGHRPDSSEENISKRDANRQNLAKLADPRAITEPQAHEIIAQTKPMYVVLGGLHSFRNRPPEMLMELAYRLAVEDSPVINGIRANVIVAINRLRTPTDATVTQTGITATRSTIPTTSRRCITCPTGESTFSTTTIATSTTPD